LVLNGSGTFTWTAATNVNAPAGSQWLSINPTIGTSQGAPISVLVNAAGLPPGFYTGFVTIGSGNAVNISVVVPVTLTVLESILSSNPSSLSVTATAGGASPGNRTIPVTNGGSGAAFGFAAAAIVDTPQGGSWLSVSPGAGTTGSTTLTASYDISALGSGIYTGRIVIASAQAANSPYIIPVTLTVNPSAAPALALISPSSASPGQAVTVALTGTNFSPIGNTINISGTGVTAGAVNFMGGTSLITTFTIDAAAVPGDRNVTVTTANGTSEIRSFTVTSKKGRGQLISP
jgi:hypothetical protein